LLNAYARCASATAIRNEFRGYGADHAVRIRYPRENDDPTRQGDLIVLKAFDHGTRERGVLLIKYSEAILRFAALFDLPKVAQHYSIVLEPSWWGYQDVSFFLFVGSDADVVVQAQAHADFEFLRQHGMTLTPVRVGAGDWIDAASFSPGSAPTRPFDIVM